MSLEDALKQSQLTGEPVRIAFEGGQVVSVQRVTRVARRARLRFVGGQVVSCEELPIRSAS